MCRSIRQLRRGEDAGPATTGEAQAAALQYVRKVSGYRVPSARHREAFEAAVDEIAAVTERLLASIGTPVAEGPDPFADPVARRAILDARAASAGRRAARPAAGGVRDGSDLAKPVRRRTSSAKLDASGRAAPADAGLPAGTDGGRA